MKKTKPKKTIEKEINKLLTEKKYKDLRTILGWTFFGLLMGGAGKIVK